MFDIGALINHAVWGPLLVLPAGIWLVVALLLFCMAFGDFRKTRSHNNAVFLRWTLLAIIATPLASPILALAAVGFLGYAVFTKTGWLWNNSLGVIWDALWMKEDKTDDVDAYSI